MRKTFIFAASALVALCASCAKEGISAPEGNTVLTATFENTKTALTEDNQVVWVAGDKVSVFEGSANVEATAESAGASTTLTATLTTGGPWYALYPYNADAILSDGKINAVLSDAQTAVAGTFAPNSNIAVAYSETTALQFKNVHAFIKFTLSNDLVKSIELKGNNGEAVAGRISIDYNEGVPSVEVSEVKTAITIAPASGYFEKDKAYYIAVLPVAFSQGFTLTLTDAFGETQDITTDKSVTLQRSHILNIGTPDSDITVDDIIVFADPDVEADIVKAFDKNGDGKLSKSEAAAVTFEEFDAYSGEVINSKTANASSIWTDPMTVDTFDELRYFIGLERIEGRYRLPVLFPRCTNLVSVELPYNTNEIANYCFFLCSNLSTIILPDNVQYIYTRAFEGCTSLKGSQEVEGQTTKYLIFPTSLVQLSSYAFKNCTSLVKIDNSDNVIETLGADVFENCTSLSFRSRNFLKLKSVGKGTFKNTKVVNLSLTATELTALPDSAFFGCASLETVKCSNNIKTIGKHTFNGCKKLNTFSINSTNNKKIEMPEALTSIGDYAFSNCPLLGSADGLLVLPEGVTTLGARCFRYGKSLKNVTLPSTLTKLGSGMLTGSGTNPVSIDCVTCYAVTPPPMSAISSKYGLGEDTNTTIASVKVPAASVDAYKAAQGWSNNASVISAIE